MQGNSAIYMGDDGNYHDKTPEQIAEEGKIAGEEIVGDGTGEVLPDAPGQNPEGEELPVEKSASAKTRKQ